jgi:hypothetical protein
MPRRTPPRHRLNACNKSKGNSKANAARDSNITAQILAGDNLRTRIARYFYQMINASADEIRRSSKEEIPYKAITKYLLALSFFKVGNLVNAFRGWVTQFYPFSILFRNRWFHADNRLGRRLADYIEVTANKSGFPIHIFDGEETDQFFQFVAKSLDQKRIEIEAASLERALNRRTFACYDSRGENEDLVLMVPKAGPSRA